MASCFLRLALATCVIASGKKLSMKSISFTADDGLDILNPHGRDLSAGRRLSLFLELHNKEDDHDTISNVNCTELELIDDTMCPFDTNARFRVHGENGIETFQGYSCHTFANEDNTCMVTLSENGALQGVWLDKKHVVDFSLQSGCSKDSCADVELNPSTGDCGAESLEAAVDRDSLRRLGSKRKDIERKLSWQDSYWLSKWTNCYAGDDSMTNIFIGVAVGSTLTSTLGGVANVKSWLEAVVAEANAIYRAQLNVKLHVTDVEIVTSPGSQSFDNPGCSKDIDTAFSDFQNWQRPAGSSVALWHYFDDCHKSGASAIGLGYIGALCASSTNIGMTHYSSRSWLTFAHEIGHNFGGRHTTEGIMDTGSKILDNEYQFSEAKSKSDICGYLSSRLDDSSCENKLDMNPTSTCGNKKLESNEECECPSGTNCKCCENCRLKPNAQCSPDFGNDCCTSSCQYADTRTECKHSDGGANGIGYCRNGICGESDCGLYGLGPFCGVHNDNPCKKKCMYANSCQSMNGWTSNGEPINHIRDGALCRTSSISYGKCKTGVCVAVENSNPTSASTNYPTPLPVQTNAPTSFPTPSPVPDTQGSCLTAGTRCFNYPEDCCSGLRCPMEEYNAGELPRRKVKCTTT